MRKIFLTRVSHNPRPNPGQNILPEPIFSKWSLFQISFSQGGVKWQEAGILSRLEMGPGQKF